MEHRLLSQFRSPTPPNQLPLAGRCGLSHIVHGKRAGETGTRSILFDARARHHCAILTRPHGGGGFTIAQVGGAAEPAADA